MTDQPHRPSRLRPWLLGLWLALVVVTLVLAYWGWLHHPEARGLPTWRKHENALFMAIRAFGLDVDYTNRHIHGDWRLILARWTGLIAFASALIVTGLALLRSNIAALRATLRRNHTLVVGDHEMAAALVQEALREGRYVTHVSTTAAVPEQAGRLITLPRGAGEAPPFEAGRARQARRVIVAETDLGASVERGLEALHYLNDASGGGGAKVAVHLDDPIAAERLHHASGGMNLFAFSEAHAVARTVMLRHPPFLLARKLEAPAIHILIVGFGAVGQAIARDLALNSLTADLAMPTITVIGDQAAADGFRRLHPEFRQICHLHVCADLDEAHLKHTGGNDRPPVCAAYICHADSAHTLSDAFSLRERTSRHDLIQGPIFARMRAGGLMRPEGGVAKLEAHRIYSFGALADAAVACMALEDDPEAAAKSIDAWYASVKKDGPPANWETLSEEKRISNRRVISHTLAKLASLGFDLEPWLQLPDSERTWPPPLDPDAPLFRDEGDRVATAVLEHDRWMADRRLNSWVSGPKTVPERKIHECLIPYEHLAADMQAFDLGIADWLKDYLPVKAGGLKRPGV
jgi:hypothetical protein